MSVQTLSDPTAVPALSATMTARAPASPAHASSQQAPSTFHQLLSELNPLQYLPVIGTIYRAVTGDTIPEPVRELGSLAVSGLMGGPIGIATNLGMLALEKVTGIDPEEIGQKVMSALHLSATPTALASAGAAPLATDAATDAGASSSAPAAQAATTAAPADPGMGSAPVKPAAAQGWSTAQLAAYGIGQGADGSLKFGSLAGADVLNQLELARLAPAGRPEVRAGA